jgi:probable F420-dependent oxidoreductase
MEEGRMRFMVDYPIRSEGDGGAWIQPENIAAFARAVEEAGLDAISFTDHPAPSKKWLDSGGHETFDPFVALGFCAAVTSRIRLINHLVVVPYRNPILQAKSMTSLDVLSRGRATFVLGTGYLRSEYAALGVDFAERNALFDEAVEAMQGLWSSDEFRFEGRHFTALGVALRPPPVQKPHPPLWLGGNSHITLKRVARWGQGWAPHLGTAEFLRVIRTRPIEMLDDLGSAIGELAGRLEEHGRSLDDIDICASTVPAVAEGTDEVERRLEHIEKLAAMGVTWTGLVVPRDRGPEAACEAIARFGEDVATL